MQLFLKELQFHVKGVALMNPVIKGCSHILVHVPNVMLEAGTTQILERENKNSDYLLKINDYIRSYEDCISYPPNQAYIGNIYPDKLNDIPRPWYQNPLPPKRFGSFGEIMPEDEFYALMQISDVFDLVLLEKDFVKEVRRKLEGHPLISEKDLSRLKEGVSLEEIERQIENKAVPLRFNGKIVGCVKKAHDKDITLSSHVMLENLATKASAVLAFKHLLKNTGMSPEEIDYIIECSEEACGDMNQRGGGNFAKAIGEIVGCSNATGADVRGFCAGPAHALLNAASLVKAGVFKNIVVVAGGATAKLGMNGRDHVKKGLPLLEDVLGGFAVLVSQDDGINPIIRLDSIGRHTIGAGASPQAVMHAVAVEPLERLGLKVTDVDKYSVEMQNPEITEPAGAGDVPKANYKMIAALGVKRGDIEKSQIDEFILKHGMPGFAPTQGHIPSGVPVLGHIREKILKGEIKRAMIIGKGSLFLARMTNLFDGISMIIEANPGVKEEKGVEEKEIRKMIAKALRDLAEHLIGSEV